MHHRKIPVNSRTTINIVLAVSETELQEVVVIGYGTVRKEDATGSVKAVSSEYFNRGIVSHPRKWLSARWQAFRSLLEAVPPVREQQSVSGEVLHSRASNDPLIVIDGVAVDIDGPIRNEKPSFSNQSQRYRDVHRPEGCFRNCNIWFTGIQRCYNNNNKKG